jgi:hypothetical protein
MAWEPSWQALEEVENLIEKDMKDKPPDKVDCEGFRVLTMKERVHRAVAMVVFIIVFPFVAIFLGIYRLISMIPTSKDKRS